MLQVHFPCPKCQDSNVTHAHDDDFVFAQIRDSLFYIECGKCKFQIPVRKRRVPGLEVMQ
jgi:transcription elongation factor Elf1